MRTGGGAVADRQLGLWCVILTALCIISIYEMVRVKKNYTAFHHRFNELEDRYDKAHGGDGKDSTDGVVGNSDLDNDYSNDR